MFSVHITNTTRLVNEMGRMIKARFKNRKWSVLMRIAHPFLSSIHLDRQIDRFIGFELVLGLMCI